MTWLTRLEGSPSQIAQRTKLCLTDMDDNGAVNVRGDRATQQQS